MNKSSSRPRKRCPCESLKRRDVMHMVNPGPAGGPATTQTPACKDSSPLGEPRLACGQESKADCVLRLARVVSSTPLKRPSESGSEKNATITCTFNSYLQYSQCQHRGLFLHLPLALRVCVNIKAPTKTQPSRRPRKYRSLFGEILGRLQRNAVSSHAVLRARGARAQERTQYRRPAQRRAQESRGSLAYDSAERRADDRARGSHCAGPGGAATGRSSLTSQSLSPVCGRRGRPSGATLSTKTLVDNDIDEAYI
ncbi:hypothetical protein AAFF_G00198780 [Aldrovandia affinis]|uniref:Uncharacterized protein n=1 Tax=Aldrovandia affinis TaxID=143900 RepID=A0AAD7W5S4_9TELE|nr:hypothetical protein AAFF_G00198780 [Aldrovandia affinis]